ncbi:MAG: HNH endonuclease [Planctomycetota bacterium]
MARIEIKIPDWLDRICVWPMMWYRRRKYGYDYRKIDLGDGRFTILDKKDYYELCNYKWTIGGHGSKFYAVRVVIAGEDIKTLRMHREIMNAPEGLVVDHKNSNSLDNRRENLRIATQAENMLNRKKRANTSSRYIGVWFAKEKGKWESRITHKGKKVYIGSFEIEEAAARAYDVAAKKYRGEFARLNFPEIDKPIR